jgi:hypothetical protein
VSAAIGGGLVATTMSGRSIETLPASAEVAAKEL